MIPQTWLYRHDEIVVSRPYAFDVDEEDWLWEGCGPNRIVGHNLRTDELRIIPIRETGWWVVYSAFAWEGKLVLVLGDKPFYIVLDPKTGECSRRAIPTAHPIVWYGTKTPNGKLILFERSESKTLVLDGPEAEPRAVQCPFEGQLAYGVPCSDGLVYCCLENPARAVRFDPVKERFVDQNPMPFPEATISGRFEHKGILYCADSARGRLIPLELRTGKWLDPIPTPDAGKLYGFVGGAFGFQGKGYFCLSTYAHPSRLDVKTRKIVVPEGPLTVDGRPPRFMDRFLVYDAETGKFDYLVAPPQPDGVPLLCYNWTDGKRFVITGIVLPFARPGEPGPEPGPWLVIQSEPATEEPGFGPYDPGWDRAAHVQQYRRSYATYRSLYFPSEPWTPAIVNMMGPATQFMPGKNAELSRRADKTDAKAYWKHLAETVLSGIETDALKAKVIGRFVNHAIYYNPVQEPQVGSPVATLESHDGRCGNGVDITLALLEAAGIQGRTVPLNHHVVAEAFCDGSWHILDALFFGANQPAKDGRVLSVDELKAEPYFADAYPQHCFAYDPELLLSEDGYQLLGYCFGPWGSEPYYSYYLFAEKDNPPTLPSVLPAQRLEGNEVLLHWSKSVKFGGGQIEYEARVFTDRACQQEIFRATTPETGVRFTAPEQNRMYFVEVRAMDEHRAKNPNTWYPAARYNFVLVPAEQYGWYGVM